MELSKEQVPDSCTVFAPANPSTAVPAELAELEEAKIANYGELLEKIVSEAVIEA